MDYFPFSLTGWGYSVDTTPVITVQHLRNILGNKVVHEDVSFEVNRGEIIAIIGGSGCGKTTLLRSILQLLMPTAGSINVFGTNIMTATEKQFLDVGCDVRRWRLIQCADRA